MRLLLCTFFVLFNMIFYSASIATILYDLLIYENYQTKVDQGFYAKANTFVSFLLFGNSRSTNILKGIEQNNERPIAETTKICLNLIIEIGMLILNTICLFRLIIEYLDLGLMYPYFWVTWVQCILRIFFPEDMSLKWLTVGICFIKILTKLWSTVLFVNVTYFDYYEKTIFNILSIPAVITELILYEIRLTHGMIRLYLADMIMFSYVHDFKTKLCGNLYCAIVMVLLYNYDKYIMLDHESMGMTKILLSLVDIVPEALYAYSHIYI